MLSFVSYLSDNTDRKMLISTVLCLICYVYAFGTINSLPNGSSETLELAERVAILEDMIVNQQFNIRYDEHQKDIGEKSIHTTSLIHEMESRIRTLENKVNDQELIIAKQKNSEEQNYYLKKTVGDLKLLLIAYDQRFQKLERKVGDQERIIAGLKQLFENDGHDTYVDSSIYDLDIVNRELNSSNYTTMIDRNRNSKKEIPATGNKDNQNGVQRRLLAIIPSTPDTGNTIAFYAIMSKNTPSITLQHPLRFDVVKTNQGNAYHPTTGVFMVPQTGMYVFTWTVRIDGDNYHSTELMVNTESMGIVHLNTGGTTIGEVTGIVVVHVDNGDDVFVRTYGNFNGGFVSSDHAGQSSFAGWKLA